MDGQQGEGVHGGGGGAGADLASSARRGAGFPWGSA